ncbi:glycyl-tRNA synthetase beta subunit [Pseudooceanicola batsensis HTCC2597]|uniref:Glycine--tRNA ligase beta subunit n=1 Tax=Pseudooceanicola batsensis (strain ATCC BAA-863 / DSM 15984 / KCTC 12145 / HTCC2597) TaxID=252305 RepID=A3TTN4_PSEBH|nr:glycine--tRNA ligase subunit beta [Pseudooceanicola batsensis]EAQ05011.1 glycyl-tRNA synthetase beta subunit [Pseudooceanicola batsensis HTCC2597]
MPDLLIELFSEEIPARMQARAAADLKSRMTDGLVEAGLTYGGAASFHTPRRLCLAIEGLLTESPTLREERKGPRVDAPEKAIEGFLRGAGVAKEDLQVRDDKKGQVYVALIERPGRPAAEIVAEVLTSVIRNFPWPKSMRWGSGSLKWVRPLHSILCILSDESGAATVPIELDGLTATDRTHGHRFMAPGAFSVTGFEDYTTKLKRACVVLDAQERADHIWQDATNLAFAAGLEVVEDRGLLSEVAGLVEWPVVLMGDIDQEFLGLPPEVLQTSMKEHQKFFSVRNARTGRIEKFITVANRETADDGATILAGNQKVLAARLSDARFFWENDLRIARTAGMEDWVARLANVTFHNKLGSQAARIDRIAALARDIAPTVDADPALAEQAARVAKADLSSEMVYEFPELQGLMGRYYAEAAGLPDQVARAAEEHYSPLGPSDAVPSAPVSVAVALADKIDLLTGFWSIDEKPTGSKDPFALRRAALGVIRLVLANGLRVDLDRFFDAQILRHRLSDGAAADQALLDDLLGKIAHHGMSGAPVRALLDSVEDAPGWLAAVSEHDPELGADLLAFFHDRLKVHLRDEGIRHDVIDVAIAMPEKSDLALVVQRAEALSAFLRTEDGENLVQGFKRANNILTQAEDKDGVAYEFGADPKFAEDASETALFEALERVRPRIETAMAQEEFEAALSDLATLRAPIDAFFEAVQVNAENEIVRRNRLNLLSTIRTTCLAVADLTRLEG